MTIIMKPTKKKTVSVMVSKREKPPKLEMSLDEAMRRIVRVPTPPKK
jgi:hypothetical protein